MTAAVVAAMSMLLEILTSIHLDLATTSTTIESSSKQQQQQQQHTAAAAAAAAASSSSLTTTFDRASLIASLRPGTNIAGLSDYEILRVQRIQRNEAKLASLGLLCITSKPTSSSSGIRGKGSTDNVPFQTPPNPTEPESEPESEPENSKCSSPGPGWTYPPDEHFSRHWTSPTRKISFLTHPAACQFEELRNKFGSDEVQAWEEYRKLNPFLENTIVTPEKYVDASRRGRGLTTTRAATLAQNPIKRGLSNEAAVNCISNNNLCFMCKDGGGKLTISAARPILDPET